MILSIEILGILTMCTIVFILIWGFIVIKQTLSQIKYKNYLLEQIAEHLHRISENIRISDIDFPKDEVKK
ncbi:MAG: hypothetical protein LKE46_00490 [Clostridium sp.]|jgi:hypothetical protein|uniref:hypothetical protein n=1 Tax=Clostridium sp. TaxID=1506 RepID=UPI0025C0997F|nr:hypothetical protein [Clostridium sp.]MCH3962746.1 hypothetical protein [Clostridium sp.]MCI1715839.1 hypothetical protein [Clostridium sp.]MCI1799956.1 hypothetical protein [Clostridium sp.]MCI1813870.1 hypothetical protein [Clostridium sp.]MCI1870768.1 hypothetical protein [Clostridium sp.]